MGNARGTRNMERARQRRRLKSVLACSTALTALAFAPAAHAEGPAPLATPTGGTVVAGQASIAQAPAHTTVTQGSARAAINWQSFDVGSRATVTFQQPSAQAVTLNRVLAADPSTIAGHINANGSIVLINPNGVVFANGSEVNAAGLVVSAAGISNRNFMAGKMVFDQAGSPNARIVNKGTMTIGQAGLAALVAPQVENSGVIDAKLGSVMLAGARTATLDLYGDGLVSLDVTSAVRSVPVGPNGKPATALVTNSGTIMAQGGTVELTAAAVDGLVQGLVDARGSITANGMPGQAGGTVLVQGVGGSIQIAGALTATGTGAGGTGGAIGLDATGGVAVAKNARIDASGPAGGGVVAVGTTLARARGGPAVAAGPTAAHVRIAQGATIAADATDIGDGGRVTVLSTKTTADHGAITAEGGPAGGNGGFVEVSGHDLALDGSINTMAPLGKTGTILLDPFNLEIVSTFPAPDDDIITFGFPTSGVNFGAGDTTPGATSMVSATALEDLEGDVRVQAINNLEVKTNLTISGGSLTLQAGNNLTIDPGVTVSADSSFFNIVELDAATSTIPGFNPAGALTMNGIVQAALAVRMSAGTGGIHLGDGVGTDGSVSIVPPPTGITGLGVASFAPLAADPPPTGVVTITTTGPFIQTSGIITAGTLIGTTGGEALITQANTIANLGAFTAAGNFSLTDAIPLTLIDLVSVPTGDQITLRTDSLTEGSHCCFDDSSTLIWGTLSAVGGEILIEPFTPGVPVALVGSGPVPPGTTLALFNSLGGLDGILDVITANTLALTSAAAPITVSGANPLGGLTNPHTGAPSGVNTLLVNADGAFTETSGASLDVGALAGSAASVALNGANNIPVLGPFSSSGGFAMTDATPLTVLGNVTDPTGIALTVSPGSLALGRGATAGTLSSTGTVNLQVPGGTITDPNGSVTAGTLTGTASKLAVFGPGSAISALGTFTVSGGGSDLSVASSVPMAVTGPVTAGTLAVAINGALTETATGVLDVGVLTGNAGSVALGSANTVPILEAFASIGSFALTDTTGLTVLGSVTAPGGIALNVAPGSLAIGNGPIAGFLSSTDTVNLQVPDGTIIAANGGVTAGTLTGTASNLAVFGFGSNISALGSFTVSGAGSELSLTSSVPLVVTGPVTAGTFFVADPGAVTEAASGVLDVGVLTGNAGSVALGSANVVPVLEEFTSTASFALTDTTGLTVLGSVSAPGGITLLVNPGSLALGNASTFGLLSSADTVNLQVPNGSITVPNGHLQAGTLTGSASGLASFGTANVATLGSFSVAGGAGQFALANNAPLTITGPVSAAFLDISATGSLDLAGSLTTAGLPLAEQSGTTPALPGSVLTVLANDAGTAQFQQTGTSVITPFGGRTATLRVQLPAAGGTASFADLVAPSTNLVLALGSGRATGTMTVGQLLVIGAGGSANLFGSVRGITGPFAASFAAITPAININYLFNMCPIETVCGNLVGVPPPGPPVLVSEEGYPLIGYPFFGARVLQPEIILSLPLTLTEERNWADPAGFPLPNIARTDY